MQDTTRRWHHLLGIALVLTPLPAQQPAVATTGATWTADEAMLFDVLRHLAVAPAQDGSTPLPHRTALQGFGPAHLAGTHLFAGGRFATPDEPGPRQGFVIYVWPQAGAGRTFCLASTGALLLADLGASANGPDADAATGAGSRGRPQDLLQGPGKGRNGALWTSAVMVPTQRLRLWLSDEDGRPVAGGRAALVPRTWLPHRQIWVPSDDEPALGGLDASLPAGEWTLAADGSGQGDGIAAHQLCACAGEADGLLMLLPAANVHLRPDGLALTLPRAQLRSVQRNANESAAIATLKILCSAQAQCQAAGVIDADNDGAGEYGFFAELAGAVPVRSDQAGGIGTSKIAPPMLGKGFANVQASQLVRGGYVFQIWLPDATGGAVAEAATGGSGGRKVGADMAEVLWCAYAWPLDAGRSGARAFFVSQAGDVLGCSNDDGAYSGLARPPQPAAAFEAKGDGKLHDRAAANAIGKDGKHWRVIG